MSDEEAREAFRRIRWADNGGEAYCPRSFSFGFDMAKLVPCCPRWYQFRLDGTVREGDAHKRTGRPEGRPAVARQSKAKRRSRGAASGSGNVPSPTVQDVVGDIPEHIFLGAPVSGRDGAFWPSQEGRAQLKDCPSGHAEEFSIFTLA